jgi:hypothetical protein
LRFKVDVTARFSRSAPVQIDGQVRIGISLYRPTRSEVWALSQSNRRFNTIAGDASATLILGRILTGRACSRTMSDRSDRPVSGHPQREGFALLKLMALISLQLNQ